MEEREFDKYILEQTPDLPFHPPGSFEGTEMFFLTGQVIPGAFRVMSSWLAGPWEKKDTYKPHAHPHNEVLMFLGSDYSKPQELGGEIEFWFKDDKYVLTKSCIIFVPAMVQHNPMRPIKVDNPMKPILFVGIVPSSFEDDVRYFSRVPKWDEFKNPPAAPGVRFEWLD